MKMLLHCPFPYDSNTKVQCPKRCVTGGVPDILYNWNCGVTRSCHLAHLSTIAVLAHEILIMSSTSKFPTQNKRAHYPSTLIVGALNVVQTDMSPVIPTPMLRHILTNSFSLNVCAKLIISLMSIRRGLFSHSWRSY